MDDIKKGFSNRLNNKFLAKFVTNKSINLDSELNSEKNEDKLLGEDLKAKILNLTHSKKPSILDDTKPSIKSNGAVYETKSKKSQNFSCEMNISSIRSDKTKNKNYSLYDDKYIKEIKQSKQIIESNSKITFQSPEKIPKQNRSQRKENNYSNVLKIPGNSNILENYYYLKICLRGNTSTSKNNNETKTNNVINLKKNISKNSEENGKKSSLVNKSGNLNEKSLKKPSIFSSPVSINKKIANKKVNSKSPLGIYAKQQNNSKIFSKSNFLTTNGHYLLTDETETNSRLNTVQAVEILKSQSLKNNEDTEFIKNKYKNLLENLRKPKYSSPN